MKRILILLLVLMLVLSACVLVPIRTYEITFNDGRVITVSYFKCASDGFAIKCYDNSDGFQGADAVYYNVSSLIEVKDKE